MVPCFGCGIKNPGTRLDGSRPLINLSNDIKIHRRKKQDRIVSSERLSARIY